MAKERSLFKNESFYEVLFFLTALACMLAFVLIQPFGCLLYTSFSRSPTDKGRQKWTAFSL